MVNSVHYSNRKGIYKDLYRAIDTENKKKEKKDDPFKAFRQRKGIYVDLYRQLEEDKAAVKFTKSKNNIEKEDMLHKYPLKALMYSNNVGEALKPLVGNLIAKLSWIPAIFYALFAILSQCFNPQENGMSKSDKVTKETLFQTFSSFIIPYLLVKNTQKITNKFIDKIPIKTKEVIKKSIQPVDWLHRCCERFKNEIISGHRNFAVSTINLVTLAVAVKPIDNLVEYSLDRIYNHKVEFNAR